MKQGTGPMRVLVQHIQYSLTVLARGRNATPDLTEDVLTRATAKVFRPGARDNWGRGRDVDIRGVARDGAAVPLARLLRHQRAVCRVPGAAETAYFLGR